MAQFALRENTYYGGLGEHFSCKNMYSIGLGTRFTYENMYSSSLRKRFTCENTYSHGLGHILQVKIHILVAWGPANMFN